MLKRLSLGRQFSLLLGITFLVGVLIAYAMLSQALKYQVETEVAERAAILLQTMQSVRDYTSDHIPPLIGEPVDDTDPTPTFDAEAPFVQPMVPNFAADEVFERFRTQSSAVTKPFQYDFADFQYKEAAINPTKDEDLADPFEADLIQEFQQDKTLQFLRGYRADRGSKEFYITRPIVMRSQSCLQCHGDPKDSPLAMRKMYGETRGFGWQLGDVVAAQTIYVPAGQLVARGNAYLKLVMAIFGGIFLGVALVINFGLRHTVTRPLGELTAISKAISQQNFEDPHTLTPKHAILQRLSRRHDEPGTLAQAFQFMVQILTNRARDLQEAVNARTQALQQEMRDRQKAQAALQVYFHAISHDLRNLVMGTSLMLQGLLQTADAVSAYEPTQTDTYAEIVAQVPGDKLAMLNKTCDRQLKLVNSLMATHDAEIWGSMLQLEAINLHDLVAELTGGVRSRLDHQNAHLHNDLSPQLPLVAADSNQLSRVFENLIDNALKYNPDGVQIIIRGRPWDAARGGTDTPTPQFVCCEVIDNGIGIDSAIPSDQLFELYHRHPQETAVSGSGLGLYICRQIITAHGGQIGINAPGEVGARFWFTLPVTTSRRL